MDDFNTDFQWENWGCRDPYFGVITHPRYRKANLNAEARAEFFASGEHHVAHVMDKIQAYIDSHFNPRSVLDFGCGVGRLLIPFGVRSESVVGIDISQSMLAEANKNVLLSGLDNILLVKSDDQLSQLTGTYELVHSFIVFQHIPAKRGRLIFKRLVEVIAPQGVGAIQILYGKQSHKMSYGLPEQSVDESLKANDKALVNLNADPEMQMNPYILNEFLFILQQEGGVDQIHIEFTDHGGELGAFLFFRKPRAF